MRDVTNVLIALLLLINPIVLSQSDKRTVAFDCPKLPTPEFHFELERQVIALLMQEPTSDMPPLFNTLDNLSLRSYRRQSVIFKEIVEYYQELLKARQWNALGLPAEDDLENDTLHLYTLEENDTVYAIFAIVKSTDKVYLINITGAIPKKQLGPLLINLNRLGIEIPELMSLNPRNVKIAPKQTPAPTQTAKATRTPSITSLEDLPLTRAPSILKSMTISEGGSSTVYESIPDTLVTEKSDPQTSKNSTRFWAGDVPIHKIRIRGNQKMSKQLIQQALQNSGSPDLQKTLKTFFKAMPYFKEVSLQVEEESSKYIATITVNEKPLSTDAYLGLHPLLRLGFNRVTGWKIGTGLELGKRKDIGPLWTWSLRDSVRDRTSKLFGKVSYAFGNPHLHYRLGGTANWGIPYIWNLGLTTKIHRLTDVVAPELFPNYNTPLSIFQRIIGTPDLQNYYLRQGADIALRWIPVMPTHSFKLSMVKESHASLQKSTDWFVANWRSNRRVRENPPIIPGQMRSLTFQYDFRTRINSLGWHNTLLIEHSNAAVGSDFDFTRLLLHLRYAFRLQNNRIRTRFLFGFSDATLPIQRQFIIDGIEGLRGYSWRKHESESESFITYKSGHTDSPYTFAGDCGFLFNVEYHHSLANLSSWRLFKNAFAIIFLDEGQVWHVSGPAYTFEPKGNIGIGAQIEAGDSILRVNIAKAFESGQGIQVMTVLNLRF